jgi:hypothetical protein
MINSKIQGSVLQRSTKKRREIDLFEKKGSLFKGSISSSNTKKVNIKRCSSAFSAIIKGRLRLIQVESKVEGNKERNLQNKSTSPRSFLFHSHTNFSKSHFSSADKFLLITVYLRRSKACT